MALLKVLYKYKWYAAIGILHFIFPFYGLTFAILAISAMLVFMAAESTSRRFKGPNLPLANAIEAVHELSFLDHGPQFRMHPPLPVSAQVKIMAHRLTIPAELPDFANLVATLVVTDLGPSAVTREILNDHVQLDSCIKRGQPAHPDRLVIESQVVGWHPRLVWQNVQRLALRYECVVVLVHEDLVAFFLSQSQSSAPAISGHQATILVPAPEAALPLIAVDFTGRDASAQESHLHS